MREQHIKYMNDMQQQQSDLDGFSKRLNYVLDKVGFVKGRGRLTEFSLLVDERKTKTRNWLQNDMYPRGGTMAEVLEVLYEKKLLPSSIDKDALKSWLENGSFLFQNPFDVTTSPKLGEENFDRIKIYLYVYEEAKKNGINLLHYSEEVLEEFFNLIFLKMAEDKIDSLQTKHILTFLEEFEKVVSYS